jgi:hypothetical protein
VSELHLTCESGCDPTTQLLPAVKVTPVTPPQQQQQQPQEKQQQQQQQPKHRHHLPPGTVATSPCAHALAAVVRKQTGQKHKQQPQQQQPQQQQEQHAQAAPSPDGSSSGGPSVWVQPEPLAQVLAERLNALLATTQALAGLHAAATKGHINILQQHSTGTQQQQMQQQQQQQQQHVPMEDRDKQQAGSRSRASTRDAKQQQQQEQQQSSTQSPPVQQQQQPQAQPHKLEVRMVPNQFIQEEFLLWQRYQVSGTAVAHLAAAMGCVGI